jgi:hypothetical protein
MSRLTIYGRIETPDLRWAWIGLVVEGPSIEIVLGPFAVTVSWGLVKAEQTPHVFALRRERPEKMRITHDADDSRSLDLGGTPKA